MRPPLAVERSEFRLLHFLRTGDACQLAMNLSSPCLHHALTAEFTGYGFHDPCRLRLIDPHFFQRYNLILRCGQKPVDELIPILAHRFGDSAVIEDNTDAFFCLSIKQRIDMLPIVFEDEVALAECAAGNILQGIHAAGIVLNDRYQLLIS